MQVNNSQPSFGSTLLKLTPDTPVANKYLNKVRELFELKGFMGDSYVLKPQLAADQIDFSQAAVITKGSDMIIVGKNGGENGYDTFIGKMLKQAFPDDPRIIYRDDVAHVK